MDDMALLTDPSKIVAANLRRLMAQMNISGLQLAEKAGVPQSRISEMLRGERDSRMGTVDRVARALGVPLVALLHPVDDKIS